MKFKQMYARAKDIIARASTKIFAASCMVAASNATLAANIIPIATDDQTADGTDFITTVMKVFQSKVVPFLMILGAIWVIWTSISMMANGIKEAQEKGKFDPLKAAIIKTVILVVIGGSLLYLLNMVATYTPA